MYKYKNKFSIQILLFFAQSLPGYFPGKIIFAELFILKLDSRYIANILYPLICEEEAVVAAANEEKKQYFSFRFYFFYFP